MAGLFDKQAEAYLDARPTYPGDWYSMLAHQTSSLSLAWDVGTGNGYWCSSGVLLASDRDKHQCWRKPMIIIIILVGFGWFDKKIRMVNGINRHDW
ncbi:hypothetical protein HanHA300_Chr05g0192981 [Helianthus annuus]|nr:hypothetical protein HanHA300_Chr05g0192981 [Helianthus annuus]KAJ0586070.1 hypothetical protein HanHA89_Chr05g0207811 [Helianthus annuus]